MKNSLNYEELDKLVRSTQIDCGKFTRKPRNFEFVNDELYCTFSKGGVSTLFYVDSNSEEDEILRKVEMDDSCVDKDRKLSKEEILLKQRKRELDVGITSFRTVEVMNEKDGEVVNMVWFNSGKNVFWFNPLSKKLMDVSGEMEHVKMDVKFSKNAEFFAFIHKNEIFVQSTKDGEKWKQLTNESSEEKHITCGVADYIHQEEFDRTTGYWICKEKVKGLNCLSYFKVDSSMVPRIKIPKGGFSTEFDEYYYPRPGEKNSKSLLVTILFDDNFEIKEKIEHADLFTKEIPWVEYIVDCEWYKESLCMKLLDRRQKKYSIVLFNPIKNQVEVMHEESRPMGYINVSSILRFMKNSNRVIVGTEISGFHHLNLYERVKEGEKWKLQKQITEGKTWGIFYGTKIFVDEKRNRVFYVASKDCEVEKHIYVTNIRTSKTYRISKEGFCYTNISFDSNFNRFVCTYSNINSPPIISMFEMNDKDEVPSATKIVDIPYMSKVDRMSESSLNDCNLFSFTNSKGNKIFGTYILPGDYDKSKKYPVVIYIYGGPHVQLINNRYENKCYSVPQIFTKLGHISVIIDSEGSRNRGYDFESVIYKKMGQIELPTQIEGIHHLSKKLSISIDFKRIGIHGYSYGGYMACMAMAKHKNFFKVGVAGAPVTDWLLYDTGYTERYMDLPEFNEEGYTKGSVMTFAKNLPDEPNRLLICHGFADENVMFCNTEVLMDGIVENLKPVDVMVYPFQRHMFVSSNARKHRTRRMISYFIQNL